MLALLLTLAASAAAAEKRLHPAVDNAQLLEIRANSPMNIISNSNGKPVSYCEANYTLNEPLLRNAFFLDHMSSQARERTVGRPVHTKGSGAFGYFEVTNDISRICKASFLSEIGKKTSVAVRFSLAAAERGESELQRTIRGFAIKFYTENGNYDVPGINIPVFLTNVPSQFTKGLDALRKNPALYILDPMLLWDFVIANPAAVHVLLRLFGDDGIPASYRHMPGYGIHSMQVENADGDQHWIKWHFIPNLGIKHLTNAEAQELNAADLDYFNRDMYESIANGDYPSWSVEVQIVSEEDVITHGYKLFDPTRALNKDDFPLHKVGNLVLDTNPTNFYADIEQLAFSPGNLVDGIHGAPDKLFQARRFAYRDSHNVRLGPEYKEIPVNCPLENSSNTKTPSKGLIKMTETEAYTFDQAKDFFENEISSEAQARMIETMVGALTPASQTVKERMIEILTKVSAKLGDSIANALNITVS